MPAKETDSPQYAGAQRASAPWAGIVAGLMILAQVVLAGDGARRQWITYDEFAHLPAGINYWQKRSFFIYHHNPPLTKMLAAIPALVMSPRMEYSSDYHYIVGARPEWPFGTRFLRLNSERYLSLFVAARMVNVLLSAIGALLVFAWSRELFGQRAALVSLALWCFSPSVLAHSQVVTPDIGAAVFGLASAYSFRKFLDSGSWPRALIAGLLLGLAELTKFTMLVLYPAYTLLVAIRWVRWRSHVRADGPQGASIGIVIGLACFGLLAVGSGYGSALLPLYLVAWFLWVICRAPGDDHPLQTCLLSFAMNFVAAVLVSVLVVNAGYFFEGSFQQLGDFTFQCRALTFPGTTSTVSERINRFAGTWAGRLPVPLPRHFVTGLDAQKFDSDVGLINYIHGSFFQGGCWYYYPVALAIRTPLGAILLALAAIPVAVFNRRGRATLLDESCLALPMIAVVALFVWQDGIQYSRYLLPCVPFMCISLGRVAACVSGMGRRIVPPLIFVLLAWNVGSVLRCHPHELSYFNEFIGGPSQGHRYLLESSDWGQDLTFLKDWLDRYPERRPVLVAYAGITGPGPLGIDYSLPPYSGSPGDHGARTHAAGPESVVYCAVSTQLLHGLDWMVLDGNGDRVELPWGAYSYFAALEPVDRAGYSILIYRTTRGQLERLARAGEGSQMESGDSSGRSSGSRVRTSEPTDATGRRPND